MMCTDDPFRPLTISGILSDWDDGVLVVATPVCPATHLAPMRILEHPELRGHLWRFGTSNKWAMVWKSVVYALHRCAGYYNVWGGDLGQAGMGAAPLQVWGKCGWRGKGNEGCVGRSGGMSEAQFKLCNLHFVTPSS